VTEIARTERVLWATPTFLATKERAHVVRLLEALQRYAIEEEIYSKEVLEHFDKDIQERREERKKQQEELVPMGQVE